MHDYLVNTAYTI